MKSRFTTLLLILVFGLKCHSQSKCDYHVFVEDSLSNCSLRGVLHSEVDSISFEFVCVKVEKDSLLIAEMSLNEDWEYQFENLPPDKYDIRFEYLDRYFYVRGVTLRSNKIMFLDQKSSLFFEEKHREKGERRMWKRSRRKAKLL